MFTVTGHITLAKNLQTITAAMQAKIPQALFRQGERVMARSKDEFVPVRFGTLKNSGHVKAPVLNGHVWRVDLVYGGAAAAYAIIQHETPWYYHPVGQWKYLETPLLESVADAAEHIAADLAVESL